MKKVTLLSISLLFFTNLFAGTYSGGIGTSGEPYQISTTQDLIELSNTSGDWDKHFIQTANITFDADETNVDWDGIDGLDGDGTDGFSPIGNDANRFLGHYEGNEKTISNLFIDRYSEEYIGLFGVLGSTALVQNLGMVNADITGGNSTGGLAGDNYGEIKDCYTTGTLTKAKSNAGGIAGSNYNKITNCYSTMEINVPYYPESGGLVGYTDENSVIKYCYSTGNVNGDDEAGGFIGDNKGVISQCFSTGDVTGQEDEIGGFAGINYGDIDNCYSFGDATTSYDTDARLGGFCGSNSSNSSHTASIKHSYSIGSVYFADASNPTNFGFVGNEIDGANTTYTANFLDTEASNQTKPNPSGFSSAKVKSTAEMKQVCLFISESWDFEGEYENGSDDIWTINSTDNNGYPALAWQGFSNNLNPTSGGDISAAQSICYNSSPDMLISNSPASGGSGGNVDYIWQKSTTSSSAGYENIENSNSLTYNPGALKEDTWYHRLARVDCLANWDWAASSNVIKITVFDDFTAGEIESGEECIVYKGVPSEIGSAIDASGGDENITYQWQSSTDGTFTSPTNISNNTSTYQPPTGLTETTWYRRQSKDGSCNNNYTSSIGVWKIEVSAPRVSNSNQGTQFYYIQDAIDAADTGDHIIVTGNTGEHLYIDKELNIEYDFSGSRD